MIAAQKSHGHPLIGSRLNSPQPSWEGDLCVALLPYAEDHLVESTPVIPAAAYLDAQLAVDRELGDEVVLQEFRIHMPLVMRGTEATFVHLTMEGKIWGGFRIRPGATDRSGSLLVNGAILDL